MHHASCRHRLLWNPLIAICFAPCRFQTAEPENPWLQLEWGETLIALNASRAIEGFTHFEVAVAMLKTNPQDAISGVQLHKHTKYYSDLRQMQGIAESLARVLQFPMLKSSPKYCLYHNRLCQIRKQMTSIASAHSLNLVSLRSAHSSCMQELHNRNCNIV